LSRNSVQKSVRPFQLRDALRVLARIGVVLSILFTLLFAGVTFLPILEPWTDALSGPWTDRPAGILIVLGGDANADRILGLTSYWRAVYAVFEWRRGAFHRIVFSGAAGIAEAMRDFAVAQGVPATAIQLETRADTTRESALFVAAMLRGSPETKALLTSDYHARRAGLAFRKAGLDVVTHPFPDARKRAGNLLARWPVFIELIRETAKYGWYRWKRWI
jgi:uncharacterized SAM-binding protein YcdF (DUF218 family)